MKKYFETVPFMAFSISIWKHMGMILEPRFTKPRRYFYMFINMFQNVFQFAYLFHTKELDKLILNGYFTFLFLNAIIRAIIIINSRHKMEKFMEKVGHLYDIMVNSKDEYISNMVKETGIRAHRFSVLNFCLSLTTGTCFLIYPVFAGMIDLPYGIHVPGIEYMKSPLYEILYIYEILVTAPGASLYIPFSNLFTSFCMFAVVLVKILKHKINNLKRPNDTEESITQKLHNALEYHKVLIDFVEEINNIVTYICLIELVFFVLLLCALLFVLNIVKLLPQIIMACLYILLIMTQLFSLYWNANELWVESLDVAQTIYFSPWYEMSQDTKKKLLLLMVRTQRPLKITAGHIYPLTLQVFQSLLNVSYTYFTVLRRFYNK
uniref:Odorant receptor n=1 Tax=Phlebotomus papatasi TaxID=29031 RepID=A0A1B0DNB1_PHLPP